MTRISKLEDKIAKLENLIDLKKRKKGWKMPSSVKRKMKQQIKKPDYVVVQYLTQKYEIKYMLRRIVSGNLVVVGNKVHKLNPKKIWKWRKNVVYIIREIDREAVSNEDYEKIKRAGRDTEADVPLIKAVLGAVQKPTGIKAKSTWIIVVIIIIAIIIAAFFLGK